MDASEYRKHVTEELQRVPAQQAGNRDFLDKSKSVSERRTALRSPAAPMGEDDIAAWVDIIRDKEEEPELRASALQAMSTDVGHSHELIDMALALLSDASEPIEVRRSALRVLQVLSFSSSIFVSKRPEYLATLRSIVDDKDTQLRQQAIEILAQEKDEYVQRRLIEGLEHRSKALVGPAKAIQLLGYDVHAEHYPMLRQMVSHPPSRAAKREAVRLLAADASSKDLLSEIFRDKQEHPDIRNLSGIALQSLAPSEFEEQAKKIVIDDQEDDKLRSTCVNALTHFANPATLSNDAVFNEHVERLRQSSTSKQLRQASAGYMSKYSK